jgi:hypothetical protein
LTMKKSRTTMNVPARTTESGAQRDMCEVMSRTVAHQMTCVDYLGRKR